MLASPATPLADLAADVIWQGCLGVRVQNLSNEAVDLCIASPGRFGAAIDGAPEHGDRLPIRGLVHDDNNLVLVVCTGQPSIAFLTNPRRFSANEALAGQSRSPSGTFLS